MLETLPSQWLNISSLFQTFQQFGNFSVLSLVWKIRSAEILEAFSVDGIRSSGEQFFRCNVIYRENGISPGKRSSVDYSPVFPRYKSNGSLFFLTSFWLSQATKDKLESLDGPRRNSRRRLASATRYRESFFSGCATADRAGGEGFSVVQECSGSFVVPRGGIPIWTVKKIDIHLVRTVLTDLFMFPSTGSVTITLIPLRNSSKEGDVSQTIATFGRSLISLCFLILISPLRKP